MKDKSQKAREIIVRLLSERAMKPFQIVEALRSEGINLSESATTARVRDLRKAEYGAHDVHKRAADGIYEYFIPRVEPVQLGLGLGGFVPMRTAGAYSH